MMAWRKGQKGFTLIELMTVVVIVGILASVAIPMVSRYLRKSKTAEAGINLRKIYDGECAYYIEEKITEGGLVISKQFIQLPSTPALSTLGKGKRTGDFEGSGWGAIRFNPDSPVLYSYETSAAGSGLTSSFTVRALGDMDADSDTSLFERVGTVNANTGEVSGGAAIYTLDELE